MWKRIGFENGASIGLTEAALFRGAYEQASRLIEAGAGFDSNAFILLTRRL